MSGKWCGSRERGLPWWGGGKVGCALQHGVIDLDGARIHDSSIASGCVCRSGCGSSRKLGDGHAYPSNTPICIRGSPFKSMQLLVHIEVEKESPIPEVNSCKIAYERDGLCAKPLPPTG
jgi:hypothetical protein